MEAQSAKKIRGYVCVYIYICVCVCPCWSWDPSLIQQSKTHRQTGLIEIGRGWTLRFQPNAGHIKYTTCEASNQHQLKQFFLAAMTVQAKMKRLTTTTPCRKCRTCRPCIHMYKCTWWIVLKYLTKVDPVYTEPKRKTFLEKKKQYITTFPQQSNHFASQGVSAMLSAQAMRRIDTTGTFPADLVQLSQPCRRPGEAVKSRFCGFIKYGNMMWYIIYFCIYIYTRIYIDIYIYISYIYIYIIYIYIYHIYIIYISYIYIYIYIIYIYHIYISYIYIIYIWYIYIYDIYI